MENSYNDISSGTSYSPSPSLKKLEIQTNHEKELQKEQHEFALECKKLDQMHEQETIDKNLGWIGQTFGSAENASKNITATICILMLIGVVIVSVVVYCNERDISRVEGLWDMILPIITLSLGYLFGKK